MSSAGERVALEKRVVAKEESVDKRIQALEQKITEIGNRELDLAKREAALDEHKKRLNELIGEQNLEAGEHFRVDRRPGEARVVPAIGGGGPSRFRPST